MSDPRAVPTRVAVLTPAGRGAIAVARLWGPSAVWIADAVFRPLRAAALGMSPPGRLRVGRMGGTLGDEVVAFVTGDDPPEVEIQCHGGKAAVELILDTLREAGAVVVEPASWLTRGGQPRVTAEARFDLCHAPTLRAAEILLDQAEGALERDIRRLLNAMLEDPTITLRMLDQLIERGEIGTRLVVGWKVALAGRPNVGKSRLLNALAGYERAIVDSTPGTTRDVVSVLTAIAGWPVELSDTAGLRATTDSVEAAGVALARELQDGADLVLLVLDRSEPLSSSDFELIEGFPSALLVASKADLPIAWDAGSLGAHPVSTVRGDGMQDLVDEIGRRLVPAEIPPELGVPFRPEHVAHFRRARQLLRDERPMEASRVLIELLGPASFGMVAHRDSGSPADSVS